MVLPILVGTLLVLASWFVLAAAAAGWGRWAALLVDRGRGRLVVLRVSLWWGLGLATLMVVGLSLTVGLGSATALGVMIGATLVLTAVGLILRRPRLPRWRRPRGALLGLLLAYGAAIVYLAVKALGPVTNYDTGLYHLGSIKYAADFAAIPGIATLYFPFGYANAQFPLAAFLSTGPWDGIGYRLPNGLLVVLVATDVAIRLLGRRRTWGTYVMVVGLSASLIPLVAMADSLVTSPTSDTAVLLLTIVAAAYLADLLDRRTAAALEASVVVIATGLAVAMRPTMLVYALGILVVLAVVMTRRAAVRPQGWTPWLVTAVWVVAMAAAVALRDRILSGWLLYPLSLFPLDVPWRVPDPTGWRDATLAAARDPLAPDQYVVAHSWSWISAWIGRLPEQWETWYLLAAFAATVVIGVLARRRGGFPRNPRRLLAALLPSTLAVLAWFTLSPPSFRFIWGPLFCAVFLVLGAALRDLDRSERPVLVGYSGFTSLVVGSTVVVATVTGYSATARNQVDQISEERTWSMAGLRLPYAVTSVPKPEVVPVPMQSGLILFTPASGNEQCWDNYPLCSFSMGDDVALRGQTLQEGFTRSR